MRYVILILIVGQMIAVACLHLAACEAHVWAVERMKDKRSREKFSGWFYRYCKWLTRTFPFFNL